MEGGVASESRELPAGRQPTFSPAAGFTIPTNPPPTPARRPSWSELGGEGRGPGVGSRVRDQGDKMRKACLQIGLASLPLVDTAGPGGFLTPARHPRGPLSVRTKRRAIYRRADCETNHPPTRAFYASPLKTREPQRGGQLLLGNVVPWRQSSRGSPIPLPPRTLLNLRTACPPLARGGGQTSSVQSHGEGPRAPSCFSTCEERLQCLHL